MQIRKASDSPKAKFTIMFCRESFSGNKKFQFTLKDFQG